MSEVVSSSWRKQVGRALLFIQPNRGMILIVMGLTLAAAGFEAVEPLILKYLFDKLGTGIESALIIGIGGLFTIGLFREVISGFSNWLTWKVRLKLNYRLLEATIGRLHSLPLTYHREESVGGIMTKLDRGINGFVEALAEIAFNILPGLTYLVLSLILMFQLDWRLSLVILFFAPLPALIGMWAAAEQTRRERTLMDRWTKIFSRLNEVLSGILTVKSFTMEEREKARFLSDVGGANEVVSKGIGTDSKVGAIKNIVAMAARISAIGFGGHLVLRGEVTIGTLIAFLGYIGGLFGPVQGLTGVYQTLRKATVSLDTVFSILDAQDSLVDSPDARTVTGIRGDVVFDKVTFGYHKDNPVIRSVSLHIKPGESVALVGPSGAGKSTMMAMIQRLYDPISGVISIDGMDVRSLKQQSLRKQIGVVLQDALLFNDTIASNIAYGRPSASRQEIEEVAKAANAHDFIMNLPGGYDAPAGERGSRLSGGERQRISIARALLKDPPILILDEATSSLDAESEALVQEALARLIRGRTTFIIAHRLSTVVGADRIFVLKDGTICEMGTHLELMSKRGYYASLVQRQTSGLLRGSAA
jgi:ATP-binding cassette, subfamily B, bacterial